MKQRIGRYEVIDQLGQGATAVVYRARDTQIGRVVALKTLRPDLAVPRDMRERFVQEAKAAGQLSHPAIVAIHDVLDVDGDPCIVMECVEGRSLAELVAADGPLDPARARRLIGQLCGAIDYAHARGVLHRDIKTSNVLVTLDGEAKLGDFGIARLPGSQLTQTGAMLGTPAYMAPEALRGKAVDARSDVFSLGVVLYEVLTGANPFLKDDLAATLYQIVHVDPPPAHERNPAVPPALSAVVEIAVAKDPERRYESARAFADALAGALGRAPVSPRRRMGARGPDVPRTMRAAALIGCLALVAAGGWAGWRAWSAASPQSSRAPSGATTGPPRVERGTPAPPAVAVAATPLPSSAPAQPTAAREARSSGSAEAAAPRPVRAPSRPPTPPRPAPTPSTSVAPVKTGTIVVTTNPGVDILLDGAFKASTASHPMILPDVPLGERSVTLRLGTHERTLRVIVAEDHRSSLTHYFEGLPKPARANRQDFARDVEGLMRQAGDKVRDAFEDSFRSLKRRGGDD